MADNSNATCDKLEKQAETGTQAAPGENAGLTVGEGKIAQQRISSILQAVLDDELVGKENNRHGRRYPWLIDAALAAGLLVAVGGFTLGMFKMYISHAAKQCLQDGQYQAAITLLKGNPVPSFLMLGGDRDDDPDELLARALYLDGMQKLDQNDVRGGLSQLSQIPAGTREFDTAQKILADNFQPSGTQLTGGVVVEVPGK